MTARFQNLELENVRHDEELDLAERKDRARDEHALLAAANDEYRWGRFEPALRYYTRCLERNRAMVPAWVGQVQMLVQLGEAHEARLWSDKALELFRNNGELLAAKGQACIRLDDRKAAMSCSDGSLQTPGASPWRWIVRGEVLLASEQKQFEDCFRKALIEPAADWFDRVVIARIYRYHHRHTTALAYLAQALERAADHGYVWYEMGVCQKALGMAGAARTSFERCLELRPDYRDARDALEQRGRGSIGGWLRDLVQRWEILMNLHSLLKTGRKHDASDVHIVVGLPPMFRVDGQIIAARGEAVSEEVARGLAYELLNDMQKATLEKDWQLCFSTAFGDGDRARVTIYMRNGCPELSIRLSEPNIRARSELNLPPIVDELLRKPNGLIIISGPTGVGKTTTFNYMIDHVNAEAAKKIVTIEDPIEYTHTCKRAVVVQQEVLTDVHSFYQALVHVLRQDPDVIGIGEMRERETMYTALMAAETGHLVIATLHTPDAVQAVQRIVSAFPDGQQPEIRYMLANTLQAIIAQQLLPAATGGRRVLCCEVLVGTLGVRNSIRENNIHKLVSDMQAGRKFNMITMDHALLELYQKGEISYDTAMTMARNPETIKARTA